MWRATTDDEANFIFDLLADPDDRATALVYADWLEERGAPTRAEFLRLDVCPNGNEHRLQILRQQLDQRWLATVAGRRFRIGDVVRILRGTFEGIEGTITEVDARHGRAGLLLHLLSYRGKQSRCGWRLRTCGSWSAHD